MKASEKAGNKSMRFSRRELINLALLSPFHSLIRSRTNAPGEQLTQQAIVRANGYVVSVDGQRHGNVKLVRQWTGRFCRSRATNVSRTGVRVKHVVLFDLPVSLPPETVLYGEGFQMLSQTGGTLANPTDLGNYTDARHYRLPEPADARAFYGMMTLAPPDGGHHVLAFSSCRRFSGQFHLRGSSLQVIVDTEGLELKPGETWDLEEFYFESGIDRNVLLGDLARRLAQNHPPLRFAAPPAGWCSWYCFGPRVTAQQVLDNLDTIARNIPELKYIQIDDGYQPAMGDWLETGAAFGGNVQGVLKEIRKRGFEPAIWVAPFIAEEQSHLFKEHPDWLVKDENGAPLRADRVTFGGWRRGPWYALDGTHPAARQHLETVFRTMRREWGCTYFKLDANFWGAIHGGRFHDPGATRIEAYRRGMQAVINGAGGGFILGCNHPIWPSLGLIHGSRSSNDIKRSWDRFETTARQNLNRNWQNGRLWWNDPDAVVLTGALSEDEFRFHATAIVASGGMVLSGDDLTKIPSDRLAMLKKLLPPLGAAAIFDDTSMSVGRIKVDREQVLCLFNWSDRSRTISARLTAACDLSDYWTGESLGRHRGIFVLNDMPPHSARLLVCK
ncbi:MAG TPA: glycoside hydrolase family 36 protein [Blastocatellia bacterium]|nr:glycoside hydrolase family 36 protein [Blastocatellia bacterium]